MATLPLTAGSEREGKGRMLESFAMLIILAAGMGGCGRNEIFRIVRIL
ncbi:hypothetical protein HMPREF0297_1007 [Corynebacterium jeikeium ATCC 43734]|nr:hypothetical protein HMPREF0297_1007 [Corynebacterium jeikeium ATCC 43734]